MKLHVGLPSCIGTAMTQLQTYRHRQSQRVEEDQTEDAVLERVRRHYQPDLLLNWRLWNVVANRARRQSEFNALALHATK